MSAKIIILHGPYSRLASSVGFLPEGELCQATILAADGTAYTMVLCGGRDGKIKLIGCAGQTCIGEPTFQAPSGAEVYDVLNQYKWVSNGWSGGVPADGLDSPEEGMISASNFLGWTAFCPCISGLAPWPSSGGSGSSGSSGGPGPDGGGGGGILNPCCLGGMAATQYLSVFGACDSRLNGNYTLTWNAEADSWNSADFGIGGNTYFWRFGCQTSRGTFVVSLNQLGSGFSASVDWVAAGFVCVPFDCNGEGGPNGGSLSSLCGGNLYMTWSVTD